MTHEEIPKYKDIDDLLGPKKAAIILYVTNVKGDESFGHWCCVFSGPEPNTYTYFDPYGNVPDYTLDYMDDEAIKQYGNTPILSEMLLDAADNGHRIMYNDAPLQHHDPGNAICGRLSGMRVMCRDMDGGDFASMLNYYAGLGLTSDDVATLVTSDIN